MIAPKHVTLHAKVAIFLMVCVIPVVFLAGKENIAIQVMNYILTCFTIKYICVKKKRSV